MPLTLLRAPDARTLWDTCATTFLDQVADNPGPSDFAAHVWFAQESQVDLLYETAYARGLKGWLGPPATTMRQLATRFEIRDRRVGLLTRRRLISRLARDVAREVNLRDPSRSDGVVRGHMLDGLFGELLPEGVEPDRLSLALGGLTALTDRFSRNRNDWIVGTYRGYLDELRRRERIDTRQTNAMIASSIDTGGLRHAVGGAETLHIYGLYMLRSRQRLLTALAKQPDVDVRLYVLSAEPGDPDPTEWEAFAALQGCAVRDLRPASEEPASEETASQELGDSAAETAETAHAPEPAPPAIHVQPAPDTQRETEWVARQVKRLLVDTQIEPHRLAVVARSGHDDTGRMHRALRDAGVTATTIVRAALTEISALKALLSLFRGAADDWSYRTLRPVLDNTLFEINLDIRPIDFVAHTRRVAGLESWEQELERLIVKLEDTYDNGAPKDRSVRGKGLWPDSVRRTLDRFRQVRAALEPLANARTEAEWIELSLSLLRDQDAAAFHLRRRLCEPVGGGPEAQADAASSRDTTRWDVVRLDQRGVRQTELLLREWLDLDHPADPLQPDAWRQLLERMLEANELSITTPIHKGVQVLEAHDAALQPFDHVFVIHANDGVFPRNAPTGGVISNDERSRLRSAGIPVTGRDLELQRERALWRSVTSAGEVTVTYRTTDPSGTPLLPSLLVPQHDAATELPRTRTRYEADDVRFVPVTAAQANQRAAVALHDHLAGEPDSNTADDPVGHPMPPLAVGTPELIPHAILAAVAESYRDTGAVPLTPDAAALSPNPWNGWLRDPRVHDWLARRFGPDYPWSASALEGYSRLPFKFLLDRVLRYEEASEADEEVTALVFGWAAHDLLEKFYNRIKDDLPAEFTAAAETALEEAAAEVLEQVQTSEQWLGEDVLWQQQWRRIREQVRSYLQWELPLIAKNNERPVDIELGFGFDDEHAFIEGNDVGGHETRMRLLGRIDRVDRGPDGDQVLDYKSGQTPSANDFNDGSALQAPLYMQVLENRGRTVSKGYYRSLKPKRSRTQYGGKVERDKPAYSTALRFALSIPDRARAGLFEPVVSTKGPLRGTKWVDYLPGRDIARSGAVVQEGNRYEDMQPVQPEPASGDASWMQIDGEQAREVATAPPRRRRKAPALDLPRLPFDEPPVPDPAHETSDDDTSGGGDA